VLADPVFVIDDGHTPPPRGRVSTLFGFDGAQIRRVEAFATFEQAARAAQAAVLTARERDVFQLLARGRTALEIAEDLVLSPATVRTHVQNGITRLSAKTRVQAVSIAIAQGEIEPG
jgi:DNA-binding CsgD family transcriptional regulator